MNIQKFLRFSLIVSVTSFSFFREGCNQDGSSEHPCPSDPTIVYGKGSLDCNFVGAGDLFSDTGSYKPSADFLDDTISSHGVGGFSFDTTLGGQKINGELCAYIHIYDNGNILEKVLAIQLVNTSGRLDTGNYQLVKSGLHPSLKFGYVNFLLTDSVHILSLFAAKSGTLSVKSLDTCAHRIKGLFSGQLYDTDPSDTTIVQLQDGSFDITYVKRYFNY